MSPTHAPRPSRLRAPLALLALAGICLAAGIARAEALPAEDLASRAVVAQMKEDELRHADEARASGATELPAPVKAMMRVAAKVMTTTAHHI